MTKWVSIEVGKCQTVIGQMAVRLSVCGHVRTYFLGDVAQVDLEEWVVGHYIVSRYQSTIPDKGLLTCLLEHLVWQQHLKLFSDFDMSEAGAGLWLSLVRKGRLKASVVDLKTGQQHAISDIGTTLEDGTILPAPETVHGAEPDFSNPDWEKQQRFVYLLEGLFPLPRQPQSKFEPLPRKPVSIQRSAVFGSGM